MDEVKSVASPVTPNEERVGADDEPRMEIRIEAPVPEAVTCRIHFGRAVSPGGTSLFETPEEADAWPAVRALLGIPGVHSVIGKGDMLVVARRENTEWADFFEYLEPGLREVFRNLGPIALPSVPGSSTPLGGAAEKSDSPTEDSPAEAAFRNRVASVISEKINPALESHGGYINLLDVQDTRLFIHMGGGCQGCSMSAATLKNGVETILRSEFPEITEILDTTDHASGSNPFFSA